MVDKSRRAKTILGGGPVMCIASELRLSAPVWAKETVNTGSVLVAILALTFEERARRKVGLDHQNRSTRI